MIDALTLLKLQLRIDDRWAVGTWPDAKASVQLPVLLDPREADAEGRRPYLPGTSLAGSLRRHLGPSLAREWLGPDIGEREKATGTLSQAAADRTGKLLILGCLPIETAVKQRGATSVDSTRGAAQGQTYRVEQWAEPATVTLLLQHEGSRDEELLAALRSWTPVIGRARTSGLGGARVSDLRWIEINLRDPEQLTWWLAERDSWLRGTASGPSGARPGGGKVTGNRAAPRASWKLVVAEPVHIGTGEDPQPQADGHNATIPLASADHLIVPGSSWKGVFRHRAGIILKAIGTPEDDAKAVIDTLFGAEGARGRLAFRDSPTKVSTGDPRTHVAIDRLTGGARTTALHRVLSIPEGTPLVLAVDAVEPLPAAVQNLLDHIVKDLDDGIVTVGGHGTRGYGWVRLTDRGIGRPRPVDVAELMAWCAAGDAEKGKDQ